VNLDKTALWPPNHKLIAVNASVSSSDTLSGIASVVLTSITSSEADQGLGSEDLPDDIQGAQQNTSDTDFLLRAERFAIIGRTYTVTYTATDNAGNTFTASAAVKVSANQSGK
jgi:hypothetical protein